MNPLPAPSPAPFKAPEPGQPPATLAEVFAPTPGDGAATGFALAHLRPGARVLWVQDRASRREGGRPHAPGLRVDLLHLEVSRARDALWAMEQALGCDGLSAVIGEVWGDPAALDFTATKRLALRAEAGQVQAWLLRGTAAPDLSAARERWRVSSLCSNDWDRPCWRVTLFRSRSRAPAEWIASHDGGRLVLDRPMPVAAPRGDAPPAEEGRATAEIGSAGLAARRARSAA